MQSKINIISDDEVKERILFCESYASQLGNGKHQHKKQLYSGVTPKEWKRNKEGIPCTQPLFMFQLSGTISEFCFPCYKVMVCMNNVVDLIKLHLFFQRIKLADNNTRKCIVDTSKSFSSGQVYKGFIFFESYSAALSCKKQLGTAIKNEIATDFRIIIKRGCSEYMKKYPEYATLDENGIAVMNTPPIAWISLEKEMLEKGFFREFPPIPMSEYVEEDDSKYMCQVLSNWLKYAKSIGDTSYVELIGRALKLLP